MNRRSLNNDASCPRTGAESVASQLGDDHLALYREHSRHFERNLYVYPVLSRRSGGISVGINLNPDKACNFDCVYCQVDRRTAPQVSSVDEAVVLQELDETLDLALSQRLYLDPRFASVPGALRRVNDIAFSGDGEPTTYPEFARIVRQVAAIKTCRKLDEVKLVLITNATMLHRPGVREGLAILDASNGEIWAKLDAGTESDFRRINRSTIPLHRILANICEAARLRPVVIQSLLLRLNGEGPSKLEIEEYCRRLSEIVAAGGRIARVQIYTVARAPASAAAGPLPRHELERIGAIIRSDVGIPVEVFQ